jgi:hypothetical protein
MTQSSPSGVAAGQHEDVHPHVVAAVNQDQSDAMGTENRGQQATGLTDVYREVCAHIRATDDTSLKLLAAVPLATGIGITILVRTSTQDLPDVARSVLSLFAAVITFAIYRWERKNIATCGHFREWAAVLERDHFKLPLPIAEAGAPRTHPHGSVSAPAFFGHSWGKTQAEILLYWAVIVSWLSTSIYTLLR